MLSVAAYMHACVMADFSTMVVGRPWAAVHAAIFIGTEIW